MGKIQKLWKRIWCWWYGRKKENIQDDNEYVWDEHEQQVTIIPNKPED